MVDKYSSSVEKELLNQLIFINRSSNDCDIMYVSTEKLLTEDELKIKILDDKIEVLIESYFIEPIKCKFELKTTYLIIQSKTENTLKIYDEIDHFSRPLNFYDEEVELSKRPILCQNTLLNHSVKSITELDKEKCKHVSQLQKEKMNDVLNETIEHYKNLLVSLEDIQI